MSFSRMVVGRPVAVAMFFLAVVFLGVISFTRLPIDLLPDVSYPQLVVHTSYPEVAPREVERLITAPVEASLAATPQVERVSSISKEGVSLVRVRFAGRTDMDVAMLTVRERLDNLRGALPEEVGRPRILRTDPGSEPVLTISLAGDDIWETTELAENVLRRRLEQLEGVAQVSVTGGLVREIVAEVNPDRLEGLGLTMGQVAQALDLANRVSTGGTILDGRSRFPLRTLGEFRTVAEIEEVVVGQERTATGNQRMIRLRDVGRVVDTFQDREQIARFNGREAIGLLVFKESGANTVQVARLVQGVMEHLRIEFPEVTLELASSQAGFIQDSIDSVVSALVLGGVLAFLVLFLFLREPRYPVAVALAIPVSVVGTFALMEAFGVSLNIMSLGGLALGVGMLVDNSIVVLENIFRHREAGALPLEGAAEGVREVAGAITASTLTTVAVFAPIIYVGGVAGELLRDLSLAVAFSLLVSLLVALTLLPTIAARFRSGARDETAGAGSLGSGLRFFGCWRGVLSRAGGTLFGHPLRAFDQGFDRLAGHYHRALHWSLDHPGAVLGIAALALGAALVGGATLDRDLLPRVEQRAFEVRVELPQGTALARTDEVARSMEEVLLAESAVAAVFGTVGRDVRHFVQAEDPSGLHTARFHIHLRQGVLASPVVERLRGSLAAAAPEGVVTVRTGQATALGQLLGGSDADIAIRIRGDDLEAAFAHADRVVTALVGAGQVTNVRLSSERGKPQFEVEVLREEVSRYGIQAAAVVGAVEQGVRGIRATEFVAFSRKVPVMVRLPDALRYDVATVEALRVEGTPLRELIRVDQALGPAEIHREEQGRIVSVLADIRSGGLDRAISEVEGVLDATPVPVGTGLRVEVGGENEEMRRSFRDLAFAFGLSLILVYMILAAQFESFLHPGTILAAVPLAVIGALLALFLAGHGLNTMSLIGMVILVGIVVNDSIVKVDFIVQAQSRGADLREAIVEAGRIRLRPIIMTTVTTVLGLIPMALGAGAGADLRAPLALAVIGGLMVATLLTLLVVPVLCSVVEGARMRWVGELAPGGKAGAPKGAAPSEAADGTPAWARGRSGS